MDTDFMLLIFSLGALATPILVAWLLVAAPEGVLEVRRQRTAERQQQQVSAEKLERQAAQDFEAERQPPPQQQREAVQQRHEREQTTPVGAQATVPKPRGRTPRRRRRTGELPWPVIVAAALMAAWYFDVFSLDAFSFLSPYTYHAEVGYYDDGQQRWFVGADKSYSDCMSEAIGRFNAFNAQHRGRAFTWSCRKMQGERFLDRVR